MIKEMNDKALTIGLKRAKETGVFKKYEEVFEMINIDNEDSVEVQVGLINMYLDHARDKSVPFQFTTETRHYNLIIQHSHTLKEPFGDLELTREHLLVGLITDIMSVGLMILEDME